MTEQYPENMDAKIAEIKAYILDRIEEHADYDLDSLQEPYDLGNEIYNTDYYIIGTWQAKQWLGSDVFEVIEAIKYYEQSEFGEINTDSSSPEAIVNMFVILEKLILLITSLYQQKETQQTLEIFHRLFIGMQVLVMQCVVFLWVNPLLQIL